MFYLVNNYLFFLHFRVFKKGSPNGKITVYLGRRDFVDHVSHVDPIDGVVLVDPEYLNGRKVFGHVLAAFRYGREDLDVLGKIMNNFIDIALTQLINVLNFQILYPYWSFRSNVSKRPLFSL